MVAARNARLEIYAMLLRHHRHAADAGVAGDQIVVAIEHPVARLGELAGADAHAIAHRAHNLAVTIELEELAVLARRHPGVALVVEVQGADQIAHREGLLELAVAGIDHDAILLAVADPHIAIGGIHRHAVGGIELALPDLVAEPLAHEFAVLGQVENASRA